MSNKQSLDQEIKVSPEIIIYVTSVTLLAISALIVRKKINRMIAIPKSYMRKENVSHVAKQATCDINVQIIRTKIEIEVLGEKKDQEVILEEG